MVNISTEHVLDEAWQLFKKNWLGLTVLTFAYGIVSGAISSIGPKADPDEVSQILSGGMNADSITQLLATQRSSPLVTLLSSLVMVFFTIGMTNLNLRLIRKQIASVNVSTIIDAYKISLGTYVSAFFALMLVGIVVTLGIFCCIIPGIYLAIRLQYVVPELLDHPNLGIVESAKASWNLTKGNVGNLFLLCIVFMVIIILGLVCCCIGMLPASAFTELATIVAYCTLCNGMAPMDDPRVNVEEVTTTTI